MDVDGLVRDLVAAARKHLSAAVADGWLSEERAAELETELEERVDTLVREGLPFGRHRAERERHDT